MNDKTKEYVQLWMDKANSDLKNAEIILATASQSPPLDTVCFHCQQAAEKFIKAFLIINDKKFPFTHNLADVVAICMQVNLTFTTIQRKAETLTPFAVEIRYPDDFHMPNREESQEAFVTAVEIKGHGSETDNLALHFITDTLSIPARLRDGSPSGAISAPKEIPSRSPMVNHRAESVFIVPKLTTKLNNGRNNPHSSTHWQKFFGNIAEAEPFGRLKNHLSNS